MGKSIIHCAGCGKAIHEDDFSHGKASTIDSRSYCSDCRAVAPPAPAGLDPHRSSTSRIPVTSKTSRKITVGTAEGNSQTPLWVGGALVAVGLIGLLTFAFSGKSEPHRPPLEASVKPEPRPAPMAPAPEKKPEVEPVKPAPAPEPRIEAAAVKPAEPEKPPLQVRLTLPLLGATFRAPADIVIEADVQDPSGRVARVEFWQGTTKLGEATEAPWRFSWKGIAAAGKYLLRAKSIDRSGAEIETPGAWVTVEPAEAEVAKAPPVEPAPKPEPAPAEPAKGKPAPAPAPKKEPPQVDQKKVDLAIKKGVTWLVSQAANLPTVHESQPIKTCGFDEFVLWTLIHAGVSESQPVFRHLFKNVTEAEMRRTYEVALQAMILEELDRVRYQDRILQCAQFLADNQCVNGQWYYGQPVPASAGVPTTGGALPVPTAGKKSPAGVRQKPPVVRRLKVTPRKTGPTEGDNSNSQYAALAIRSCVDAGIDFPEDTYQRARKWWKVSQHSAAPGGAGVATGAEPAAPPASWCYHGKNHCKHGYGSMTAGAVGGLAIYDTILGDDWRKDSTLASGLSWIAKNFAVDGNPGPCSETWAKNDPRCYHYYYLYALERAGVLCRTEWMGTHPWYFDGATFLLAAQEKDGSWDASVDDTCFAILFLKRATRPLEDVASTDERRK